MAGWAASEFALDHVTSTNGLTHFFGRNKQYYSLNQKPTREECPRKEPLESFLFSLVQDARSWSYVWKLNLWHREVWQPLCGSDLLYLSLWSPLVFIVWGMQVGWYGWLFNTHAFNTHAFNNHTFLFRTAFLLLFNLRVIFPSSLPLGLLD